MVASRDEAVDHGYIRDSLWLICEDVVNFRMCSWSSVGDSRRSWWGSLLGCSLRLAPIGADARFRCVSQPNFSIEVGHNYIIVNFTVGDEKLKVVQAFWRWCIKSIRWSCIASQFLAVRKAGQYMVRAEPIYGSGQKTIRGNRSYCAYLRGIRKVSK